MILNVILLLWNFPQESIEILQGIGEWMKNISESIYRGDLEFTKPEWGYYTKDGKIYAHVFEQPIDPTVFNGDSSRTNSTNEFLYMMIVKREFNSWLAFQNVCFAQYGEIGLYVSFTGCDR